MQKQHTPIPYSIWTLGCVSLFMDASSELIHSLLPLFMVNILHANMILVGAFLEKRPVVKIENIIKALKKVLPERHHHLIPLNEKALSLGSKIVKESSKYGKPVEQTI